jgi:hypothetical protein
MDVGFVELPALTAALVHEETRPPHRKGPRKEFDLHQG